MEPGLEKQMKERMAQVSLKEVMPEFDAEEEWLQLANRLQPAKKRISVNTWRYAAALILLVAGTWFAMLQFRGHDQQLVKNPVPAGNETKTLPVVKQKDDDKVQADTPVREQPAVVVQTSRTHDRENVKHKYTSKYMISNGTDCPVEISISQTMKCPNAKPAALSASSTLEPGQSAPLSYKANDNIPKNCSLTTEEIEIKSIATGEAILLDANSSPSTAQQVFSYISGEKKGDVLAGIFNLDCNKRSSKHSLRLDNRAGNVIMQ